MPLFEYHCESCDGNFEELVRSAESADAVACPKCRSKKVSRKFSTFAARSAESTSSAPLPIGGCGRCGDPSGPCGL